MRLSWRAQVVALAMLLATGPAQADWLPGGNHIGDGYAFAAAASGPDRVIVAWARDVGSVRYEVRAQAWTAEGARVTGWPDDGVLVSDAARAPTSLAVVDDGAGGAFIAWLDGLASSESSVSLQHVSGAGTVAAGWAPEGLDLGPAQYQIPPPTLASDGAGGVLVGTYEHRRDGYFQVVVHRIDATSAPTAGWPTGGLSIPYESSVGLVADAGRFFVSTIEHEPVNSPRMRVRRLDGRATPDLSWPQAGAVLEFDVRLGYRTSLFPDGTGGVFAGCDVRTTCISDCGGPRPDRWAGRVLGDGSRDDRWLPGRRAFSLAPDRTGGMLLGVVNNGRPGAVRLDASGALMPGWTDEGNVAMTEFVYPWGELVRATDAAGHL